MVASRWPLRRRLAASTRASTSAGVRYSRLLYAVLGRRKGVVRSVSTVTSLSIGFVMVKTFRCLVDIRMVVRRKSRLPGEGCRLLTFHSAWCEPGLGQGALQLVDAGENGIAFFAAVIAGRQPLGIVVTGPLHQLRQRHGP